jgi:hypothetical protein
MGIPFLFADRFSGAVVHLTTGGLRNRLTAKTTKRSKQKMPATAELTQAFS